MSEIKKKSFLVYSEDIKEVLDELSDEDVAKLFRGMVEYHTSGTDPDFSGILKYVFIPIRQQMDRDAERYETRCEKSRANGKLGGAPVGNQNARKTTETTERLNKQPKQPKQPDIDTDIEKDIDIDIEKEIVSAKTDVWSLSFSVLSYLNQQAGTSFKTDKAEYVQLISELSHRGYTEADMIRVIDVKCADWLGNPVVERYLRPSTLFGQRFEEYLSQPIPEAVKKRERAEKRSADNAERVKAFEAELITVQDRIKSADTATRIQLREREAWLQDEIARLTG